MADASCDNQDDLARGGIKLVCPTCGDTPLLFIEFVHGETWLAARCACGNYCCADNLNDIGAFLQFWNAS